MNEPINEGLKKARARYDEKLKKGEIKRLSPVDRAALHPKSTAGAVRAMCWECVGRGEEAGARKIIATCSAFDCPLWDRRPYRRQAPEGFGTQERAAALKKIAESYPNHPTLKAASTPPHYPDIRWAKCYTCMGGEGISVHELRHRIANCGSPFPTGEEGGCRGCPLYRLRRWTTDSPTSATHGVGPKFNAV